MKRRREQDALCTIASPPPAYLGWLAVNVCDCKVVTATEVLRYVATSIFVAVP
jgi:hypothetical protein